EAASETGRALANRLCANPAGKPANKLSGLGTGFTIGSPVRSAGRNRILGPLPLRKVATRGPRLEYTPSPKRNSTLVSLSWPSSSRAATVGRHVRCAIVQAIDDELRPIAG